jgi:hypothetical protein
MGVDYDGVGGVGILITEDMLYTAWNNFHKDALNEDNGDDLSVNDKLDAIGITYATAGDGCYGGEDRYYWLVKGNTLPELIKEAPNFISLLKDNGISIDMDDIKVIEDLSVW